MIQTPLIRSMVVSTTIGTLQSLTPLNDTKLGKAVASGSAKLTKQQLQQFEMGKQRIRARDSIKYFERITKQVKAK